MNTLPRIVILQNQLDDLGGVSRFCSVLAAGLKRRGYVVEVGAVSPAVGKVGRYFDTDINIWTLSANVPPTLRSMTGLRKPRKLDQARTAFRKLVREEGTKRFSDYDDNTIVLFTQLYAREQLASVVSDLQKPIGFRVIGQYHNSYKAAAEWRDLVRIQKSYSDDDFFVCLTEEDARLFQRAGLNNSTYVLNPVDPLIPNTAASLMTKNVVSLSRYDPVKQIDHMVDAWSIVAEAAPDWQLLLYGTGPSEGSLRRIIHEKNLQNSVRLMGQASNTTNVLLDASISLNSSNNEGLPLALMEASALGVPSIVYNCSPGMTEIIEDGVTGVVVPQDDKTAFATGIQTLIRDTDLRKRFGSAARNHVLEKFSPESVLDSWEELFANSLR